MRSHRPVGGRAEQIAITGLGATTALGRGIKPLLDGALSGKPAFSLVTRFGTDRCRAKTAAELTAARAVESELAVVIDEAAAMAGLGTADRAAAEFLVALHANPDAARDPAAGNVNGDSAALVARQAGLRNENKGYKKREKERKQKRTEEKE